MKRFSTTSLLASALIISCVGIMLSVGTLPAHAASNGDENKDFDIAGHIMVTKVTDGDSLRSGKLRIRLFGIDAPEMKQSCESANGAAWPCGIAARDAISDMLGADKNLHCQLRDVDRYGRLIMQCFHQGQDIAAALVRAGLALSYREYSALYNNDEASAKANGTGMWQGDFAPPWQWRKDNK